MSAIVTGRQRAQKPVPICCFCRRIRAESGQWLMLAQGSLEAQKALFSHTLCQDCGRKHYASLM
jgi:hypothetical protein